MSEERGEARRGRNTFCCAGELEGRDGADIAKDFAREDELELARVGVDAEELQARSAATDANLLRAGPGELPHARRRDRGGREERVVE